MWQRRSEVLRLMIACTMAACTSTPRPDAGDTGVHMGVDTALVDTTRDDTPHDAVSGEDSLPDATARATVARHSSSIAISADGARVYVVNADSDSVSIVDVLARRLDREIMLGTRALAADPSTGRFDTDVAPRALALAPTRGLLFVTGQRSGTLYVIELATAAITRRIPVGSEPIGVVVSPDEVTAFVACAQDATVVRVDVATGAITGSARTAAKPWALAWSADAATLLVSHLLGPGVTPIDPQSMTARSVQRVPDVAPRSDRRLASGEVRGIYDLVVRPGSTETWLVHLLLNTATAQPTRAGEPGLDFESTVFPAASILGADGRFVAGLTTDSAIPGSDGQFGDVVSGPHAIEFTPDGRFALMLNTNSEDVLAIDAERRVESYLLHPLPGHMAEGIVVSPDGRRAYIDQRNSADVAVISIEERLDETPARIVLDNDGATIPRSVRDPMPARLRFGQWVFHNANSSRLPTTRNNWVACASCHLEGRSDAVVWRFASGPRDTPTNAGGMLATGFLFRTADRRLVRDYWHTIVIEQGGLFTGNDPMLNPALDALQDYVNLAIPVPMPPRTDPALVARGDEIFHRPAVGCATCHSGPRFTDSGAGNATLDLAGTVLLHEVGTCNTDPAHPDVPHTDDDAHPRAACAFDTPSLNGLADSFPYFHDGSAPTLRDALERTRGRMGDIGGLSPSDLDALVEYLRSL